MGNHMWLKYPSGSLWVSVSSLSWYPTSEATISSMICCGWVPREPCQFRAELSHSCGTVSRFTDDFPANLMLLCHSSLAESRTVFWMAVMTWTLVTSSMDIFGQGARQLMLLEALLTALRELNLLRPIPSHTWKYQHIYIFKRRGKYELDSSVSEVIDLSQILGTHMVEREN